MMTGNMMRTPANSKLQKGALLQLKDSAPKRLEAQGPGPFRVIKPFPEQRLLFLMGQAQFQATYADVLKHFNLAPTLKFIDNSSREMHDPQPIKEKDKLRAWQWYAEHRVHVDRLVANNDSAFCPCGSDCIRPELWKGSHWKWFLVTSAPPSRTLVRVVEVGELGCEVVLPVRDGERIPILRSEVPPYIWDLFQPGKRLHVRVNIDAKNIEDLVFSNWERE